MGSFSRGKQRLRLAIIILIFRDRKNGNSFCDKLSKDYKSNFRSKRFVDSKSFFFLFEMGIVIASAAQKVKNKILRPLDPI